MVSSRKVRCGSVPLGVVPVEPPAKAAQHRSFLPAAFPDAWRRGDDPTGEARERQALQPHGAGAGDLGEEQALAAKQVERDTNAKALADALPGVQVIEPQVLDPIRL